MPCLFPLGCADKAGLNFQDISIQNKYKLFQNIQNWVSFEWTNLTYTFICVSQGSYDLNQRHCDLCLNFASNPPMEE